MEQNTNSVFTQLLKHYLLRNHTVFDAKQPIILNSNLDKNSTSALLQGYVRKLTMAFPTYTFSMLQISSIEHVTTDMLVYPSLFNCSAASVALAPVAQ